MVDCCKRQYEFLIFQSHLIELYVAAITSEEIIDKNEAAIDFIWKYSKDIRKYFCKEICGMCDICNVYLETTRLKQSVVS